MVTVEDLAARKEIILQLGDLIDGFNKLHGASQRALDTIYNPGVCYMVGHARGAQGFGYCLDKDTGVHHLTVDGVIETPPDSDAYGTVSVYPDRMVLRGIGKIMDRYKSSSGPDVDVVQLLRCVQVTQCPVWRKGRGKFHSALQPERWLLLEHNNGDSQSEQQLYRLRQHSGGHVAPPSPTDTEQQHAR
ncbi:hypothetical protein CRENBAI_015138 [Crenichthys baileyi]|uniref:Uncharacterized protein n=1 Tax=Crenichthys baileyi TaxID=28760 RepID=A0AAV9SC45_9TELE